jgi:hypothetical protein
MRPLFDLAKGLDIKGLDLLKAFVFGDLFFDFGLQILFIIEIRSQFAEPTQYPS